MATIVVGVGGGVAAFKAATLIRFLSKKGHSVRVIPTEASRHFVGIATWEALSGSQVHTGVFDAGGADHVEIARHADLIVIAPATADLIARMAQGQANDLLTTTLLASRAPVVIAPAMHTAMWEHPATQANVALLRSRGVVIVEPVEGDLSSGDHGKGRMEEPETIAEVALDILNASFSPVSDDLAGTTVVVTAGGTHEAIDPVRFIGNHSTGRQGIELACAAAARGARVELIAAHIDSGILESLPDTVVLRPVQSAMDMHTAVMDLLPTTDVLIMAAAVADFRPATESLQKIKKTDDVEAPVITLVRNPDILAEVSRSSLRPSVLIGFAAETGDQETVLEHGRHKAARKKADLLIVNRVGDGHGFGAVANEVHMMSSDGTIVSHAQGTKTQVAHAIIEEVSTLLRQRNF